MNLHILNKYATVFNLTSQAVPAPSAVPVTLQGLQLPLEVKYWTRQQLEMLLSFPQHVAWVLE